jgi:hypothetical protein
MRLWFPQVRPHRVGINPLSVFLLSTNLLSVRSYGRLSSGSR